MLNPTAHSRAPFHPNPLSSASHKPSEKKTTPKEDTFRAYVHKIQELLNQLTLENFDEILPRILEMKIDSLLLRGLVISILSMASKGAHGAHLAAKLCQQLQNKLPTLLKEASFLPLVLERSQDYFCHPINEVLPSLSSILLSLSN